ncbi:MAG: hypothetical protein ACK4RK_14500 [Gemmataceae bacterium]
MKVVSRFEANLLRILHSFLGQVPAKQAEVFVATPFPKPPCLSRAAVELVQDSLAKGCVWLLARAGGWRPERHLRGDQMAEGRLWQRTPPRDLALSFSGYTLRFLIWITAEKPGEEASARGAEKKGRQLPVADTLTIGDWFLLFRAYQTLREMDVGPFFRHREPFTRHGLCRLAFPEDFVDLPDHQTPDFTPWVSPLGSCILEAWQEELARRWLLVEHHKPNMGDWQRMQALGQAQERVLSAFLAVVDGAGRRDLARFLLAATRELLAGQPQPEQWVGGLTSAGPRVTDRAATYRAAFALLRQLDVLQSWTQHAQSIGYLDDGYAACQAWLADWERFHGAALCAIAQALRQRLEPMPVQG